MDIAIRRARDDDDLGALWRDVFDADHRPLLPAGVESPFEPRGDAWVAEVEGAVRGFVYIDGNYLDEAWVAKGWQGCGIGTRLVGHAEAIMREAGIREAVLSVMSVNTRAAALYERLGWRESWTFASPVNGVRYRRLVKSL